ncbi:heterokaryon incompatibility protein-domain-containing protein [Phaeosphaeria sp. MPI-PUGE-AT-0046c]|nr:heterokaryon incompatibility protein-domain-containing protein [Phaeosphaeria sp. MPI-PUGE-AT-0046c]
MRYTTLDSSARQIRLLHLDPGKQETELECRLSSVSLEDINLKYEALSYVWGESIEGRVIYVEGESKPVTDSLWRALRALRYWDKERTLWVDATCIDQSNDDERSQQVALMYTIYTQASCVHIWLGEPFDNIELALQFFQDFAGVDLDARNLRSYVSPGLFDDSLEESTLSSEAKESIHTLTAIEKFMEAPWWTRTWTVQEFVLSKRAVFHCGMHTLNADTLMQCAWHLDRHTLFKCVCVIIPLGWKVQVERSFQPLYLFMRLKSYHLSFIECAGEVRLRFASDPRDKIYGLLGLGADSMSGLVRPNYSMAVEEVYETLVISLLKVTKVLDILSHVKVEGHNKLLLPSFVPDWSSRASGEFDIWSPRQSLLCAYNTCLDTEADFKAEPGVLFVRGRIYDIVQSVAIGSLGDPLSSIDTKILDELLEFARISPKHKDFEEKEERFWIAMCAGILPKDQDTPIQHDELQLQPISANFQRISSLERARYQKYDQFIRSTDNGRLKTYMEGIDELGDDQLRVAITCAHSGRRGMASERGSIGLVPMNARAGDVVAVLTGGRVPIILRPEAGYYTVVGDAYVHGIMDGEAMRDTNELDWIEMH